MLPPAPSIHTFHVVITVFPALVLCLTLYRLTYRWRAKLLGWDDALVAFAASMMITTVTCVWLINGSENFAQHTKVGLYYLALFSFTLATYAARLSILFAVVRMAPNPIWRRACHVIALIFSLICLVLIAQKVWVCAGDSEMAKTWIHKEHPACEPGAQVAITEIVTDILVDLTLVVLPIAILSQSQMKRGQKLKLYAIFMSALLTTIVCIVQDWMVLRVGGLREQTASMLEVAISILVADLPVLIGRVRNLIRLIRQARGIETTRDEYEDDYTYSSEQGPSRSLKFAPSSSTIVSGSKDGQKRRTIRVSRQMFKTDYDPSKRARSDTTGTRSRSIWPSFMTATFTDGSRDTETTLNASQDATRAHAQSRFSHGHNGSKPSAGGGGIKVSTIELTTFDENDKTDDNPSPKSDPYDGAVDRRHHHHSERASSIGGSSLKEEL